MQLTVYKSNEVAQVRTGVANTISVRNSLSLDELFERVAEASATTTDIERLMKKVGAALLPDELAMVRYAYARARFREERPITLQQCALLAQQTVAQVMQSIRYLGLQVGAYLTPDEATRIMLRNANEV